MMGALNDAARNDVFHLVNRGAPVNGTTGKGIGGKGCLLTDLTTGLLYINTGTIQSPVWTGSTTTFGSLLNAWGANFQNGKGVPLSDNAPSVTLENGIRVFGNGIADSDSGLVVNITPDGSIGTMVASANAGETIALGVGTTGTLPYKPAINGPISIQAMVRMVTDHLNRKFFIGFSDTIPNNVPAIEAFSAGNFTLNPTNVVGLATDTGVGTTRDLYALSNKLNATPIISAASAITPKAFPLAGTWITLKVVVDVLGNATFFADDVQIAAIPLALDPNIAVAPLLLLGNTLNGATRSMDVKQFVVLGQ